MTETERSLYTAAIIVLLNRAGGEVRLTKAEYESALRSSVARRMDGADVVLTVVKAQP